MRIRGISIANPNPRASIEVERAATALARELAAAAPVEVRDEFIGGSYGEITAASERGVTLALASYGIFLDPTYAGKAFAGMLDILTQEGSEQPAVF